MWIVTPAVARATTGVMWACCMLTNVAKENDFDQRIANPTVGQVVVAQRTAVHRAVEGGNSASPANFLSRKRHEIPLMAHLLADLTSTLSDGITLERLSVDRKNRLELQGLSSDTATLIDALQKSEILVHPTLQGTPQIDPHTKKERFNIVADLPANAARDTGKKAHALLTTADPVDAFAALTQRLKKVISARAGDEQACFVVSNFNYQDDEDREAVYRRTTIQVRMRCDLDLFTAIVSDLESGSPDLFISQLALYAWHGGYIPPGGKAQPSPALDIRFNLFGYQQPPQSQR